MAADDELPAAFAGMPAVDIDYSALGFDAVVTRAEETLRQMQSNMATYVRDLAGAFRGPDAVRELEDATLEFSECEDDEPQSPPRKRRRLVPMNGGDSDDDEYSDSDGESDAPPPTGVTGMFDTRRRKWPGVRDLEVPATVRTDAWCLLCHTSPDHVRLPDGKSVHETINNTVTRGMIGHQSLAEIVVSVYIIWNIYMRPLVKTVRSTLHANQKVLCPHWSIRSIVRHWRESSSEAADGMQQRVMRQDVYRVWEALVNQTVPVNRKDAVNRDNARAAFQFARLWREMRGKF